MDFDYTKHSLERLEEWVNDTLLSSEASPQEIYDVIKKATEENYCYFKHHTERCYELLALLNGNGRGHIEAYDDYIVDKTKYKCDKDDPSPKCKESWNNFWEEEVKDDGMRPWGHSDMEYLIANRKKDEVKKWVLPVEELGEMQFITFPDDLLKAANLKEGNQVEWVDNKDGTYTLKKVEKQMTYDEAIAAGWTMTDDGFWIKED